MADVPATGSVPSKVINLSGVKRTSLNTAPPVVPASTVPAPLAPAQPSTAATSVSGPPLPKPVCDFRALKANIGVKPPVAPATSASPGHVPGKKKGNKRLTSSLIILGQPDDEDSDMSDEDSDEYEEEQEPGKR